MPLEISDGIILILLKYKSKMRKIYFLLIFLMIFCGVKAQEKENYSITVEVVNANSNNGKMFFALHDKEDDFLKKEIMGAIENLDNNRSMITFKNVPKGVYAISVFHDENDNGKLDTNSIGIPKEPFGCSNNAKGFMGPPKWKNAKFEIANKDVVLTIKL